MTWVLVGISFAIDFFFLDSFVIELGMCLVAYSFFSCTYLVFYLFMYLLWMVYVILHISHCCTLG
jgi:hypothetical protein